MNGPSGGEGGESEEASPPAIIEDGTSNRTGNLLEGSIILPLHESSLDQNSVPKPFIVKKSDDQKSTWTFVHYCNYTLVRRTLESSEGNLKWIERCRCGRMVMVDSSFNYGPSNSPKVVKHWFDRNGNLDRITGDIEHSGTGHSKTVDNQQVPQSE